MTPSTLREKLEQSDRFLIGTELVSVRGGMQERNAVKARQFASQLVESSDVDWISITDNAGGNPQLAPSALGKPILYAGKEVVIHLTCKDLNRNGLESEAWLLHSEGFNNILAMTGDYPIAGSGGAAKPVFDIDSIGLITLLQQMNEGLDQRFGRTRFLIGAVTTNFKLHEGEVIPQYRKLAAKVACGAGFIINQIGFDARKMHELRAHMQAEGMGGVPLIGNVYMLNGRVAEVFHQGRIPGVVVTAALRDLCAERARSPDRGAAFFQEFAAKQVAIYRGLGFRGAYLGGVHDFPTLSRILEIERSFAKDDWKGFVREFAYSRPGEFYLYGRDPATGLADPATSGGPFAPARSSLAYTVSKHVHAAMFTPGRPLARWGRSACAAAADPRQGPAALRALEHASKAVLFRCQDCGDCSLPEIAYLCPESQCAKNQRNGPCGGTRDGRCEVDGYGDCIWLRAYDRLKADGAEGTMLDHVPVVQNQALRGTSSWANFWLGRDHASRRVPLPLPASPCQH
ncbi:MAG TPA: methylenetetrahydrofolate reductase C-terminal domain-containing protein [Opitutaceae bacterium]|jgi:methylenetetrahydrofolate reductase (NADPH)|nr:methylenetetrahydrofolate reductase C-terminal domain-containing protein [Opitutaceae bacterium]